MVSALCNYVLKARRVKNMANKILTIFVVVFVIGVISLIGVYAYKGNPAVNGPNYSEAVHDQLEAAIDNGDYDAWIKIRQENNLPMNGRMFQVINKDNFAKYAEMHDAQLSGDIDSANAIRAELGLSQGMMNDKARAGMQGSGLGTHSMNGGRLRQENGQQFIDSDNNGICDNYALHHPLN
jgi:hypothetical protein